MICNACKRPFSDKEIEAKRTAKIENARASTKKRIANGNITGPKPKIDWKRVADLRDLYWSKTKIAAFLGTSRSYISMGCIKRGIK